MTASGKVLSVEDDEGLRDAIQCLLGVAGFEFGIYESAESLLANGAAQHAACVVSDFRLPALSGLELLDAIHARGWYPPLILITAHDSRELRDEAARRGVAAIPAKPFRGEKNTSWEGGYRVPAMIRWPGVIEPGSVLDDIFAHEDMIPTIMAAAGVPDVVDQLKKGMNVGGETFKVHLDGYNITDALAGRAPSPRREFFHFNDDGSLVAMRVNQWKIVFGEQRAHGFDAWEEPFVELRVPRVFSLRADPFELAEHSWQYWKWRVDRMFLLVPAQQYVAKFLATFKEFPPSQMVGSFSLDQVLAALSQRGN